MPKRDSSPRRDRSKRGLDRFDRSNLLLDSSTDILTAADLDRSFGSAFIRVCDVKTGLDRSKLAIDPSIDILTATTNKHVECKETLTGQHY